MAKGVKSDRRREVEWRRIIREHRRSGLGIREFCRKGNLRESAFYFWRRELLRRGSARSKAEQEQQQRPTKHRRPTDQASFVAVRVAEVLRPEAACIEIVLSGGQRVHVMPPVDRQALADVLAVLESRPC